MEPNSPGSLPPGACRKPEADVRQTQMLGKEDHREGRGGGQGPQRTCLRKCGRSREGQADPGGRLRRPRSTEGLVLASSGQVQVREESQEVREARGRAGKAFWGFPGVSETNVAPAGLCPLPTLSTPFPVP